MPNRALLTAATGMQAQQQNVDNIANNIANSGTTGFKRGRIQFQDLIYQNSARCRRRRQCASQSSRRTRDRTGNAFDRQHKELCPG